MEYGVFFFRSDKLGDLEAELLAYIASAEDVSSESDIYHELVEKK